MIQIEVWSDINCPFCYIGKRHLEAALEKFSDKGDVVVEWKSFELDPMANPPKGANHHELLAKKYNKDVAWAKEMDKNLTDMARKSGLDFHMEKQVPANSFNAHRLIHLAKQNHLQDQMKERLLKAKFTEGKDIGDTEVLKLLGIELGLDQKELDELFSGNRFVTDVREDEEIATELGIRGVPFFVFNKKYGVSGAQPVEVFSEILDKVNNE
ncbi:DsbA family oxidoreductase [Peredibacter starrii]|uniref:DsbA family oxidoreductase n=1 Tax=Peredibacter starrii TaxID=28202 RepID=A0AAX4HUD9_9BACT|nr:DsbA family oxidoreductase [Peredibacter starrii]WPU66862.1 DsbA family oxidoreductase [Peredibacter starrii]